MDTKLSIALENVLDLQKIVTTGSVLQINGDYNDMEYQEPEKCLNVNFFSEPVKSFSELEKQMNSAHPTGLVKKKIIEEGGGLPLHEGCTVHIAYAGYFENDDEPFDVRSTSKPLVVDLNDSGSLLPGLCIAVKSMLVGELSVFFLSHKLMYGEFGILNRIKPKADCVFYIKLVKMHLTAKAEDLDSSDRTVFDKVHHEVKLLYSSGATLYKCKNYTAAIQVFRKAVYMLHNCRLADQNEENKQEKMLIKLYINLAVCYNLTKQPLKACTACNELHRLNSLWNNGKVLYQNAKSLRMIGQFDEAEKKLTRALKLLPNSPELIAEHELLSKIRDSCDQSKLRIEKMEDNGVVSKKFKYEVEQLIRNFKRNDELCKLVLPDSISHAETEFIKEVCAREKLFLKKVQMHNALDKVNEENED